MKKCRLVNFPFFRVIMEASRLLCRADHPGKACRRGIGITLTGRCRHSGLAEKQRNCAAQQELQSNRSLSNRFCRVTNLPVYIRRLNVGFVLLAAVLLNTAPAQASTSTWCESRSQQFEVISDLSEADQRELIRKLTVFEKLAEPFLPGEALDRRSALKMVVFQHRKDFLAVTGAYNFAGYMQPSLQMNRLMIGPIRGNLTETALHEYAHYLLRNQTGVSLPMWFDEGLASLLGAAELSASQGQLGNIPARRLADRINQDVAAPSAHQRLKRTMGATSLESWHRERINEFYDLSWLLTHYLYFDVYQDALSQGSIQTSELTAFLHNRDQTLLEHLGTTGNGLTRSLDKHLRRWRTLDPVPLPAVEIGEVTFRCLTPVERDLAVALAVHVQAPDKAKSLLAPHLETQTATESDQTQLNALRIAMARTDIARDNPESASDWIEQVRSVDPHNPEAMVLATDLSIRDCIFDRSETCLTRWDAANRSYRAALRQDPRRYDGILGVGLAELHGGRPGDAVNYLKVAYSRAPWAAVVNYYLGESYRMMGDSRASLYLENARNWAVQDIWRVLAEESLRLQASAEAPASDP